MLKKTITFPDYDGNSRTEDFYFHLSKAELMRMNFGESGGLEEKINRIVAAQDMPSIYKLFEDIVQNAYGVKSPDGRKFEKSPELLADFVQTEAYSVLLEEITSGAEAAVAFMNGIIPAAN